MTWDWHPIFVGNQNVGAQDVNQVTRTLGPLFGQGRCVYLPPTTIFLYYQIGKSDHFWLCYVHASWIITEVEQKHSLLVSLIGGQALPGLFLFSMLIIDIVLGPVLCKCKSASLSMSITTSHHWKEHVQLRGMLDISKGKTTKSAKQPKVFFPQKYKLYVLHRPQSDSCIYYVKLRMKAFLFNKVSVKKQGESLISGL